MNRLQIKDLEKKFKERRVVDSVSFEIVSEQVVGLLGPNGAGKTTSFYMVVGLLQPDQGQILLNDNDLAGMPMYMRARQGLSYLPQEASVFRRLTVRENILVALQASECPPSDVDDRLNSLVQEFNLQKVEHSAGYALSGGERRRVEIARALAGEPKFLLLDEPFAGIDPIAVSDIQSIITKLKSKGLGILITDHNVRETLGICDYAYILKDGRIEVKGTPTEVASNDLAKKFYLGENFRL